MGDSRTGKEIHNTRLKYILLPEGKGVLKHTHTLMRVCQRDIGANKNNSQWPKLAQHGQQNK